MGKGQAYMSDNDKYNENMKIKGLVLSWISILVIIISSFSMVNLQSASSAETSSTPGIEYLEIDTVIDNNYAVTDIREKFVNPNNYSIDKTFSFMTPEKAFLSNFSLTIDNETHYAQIVPIDVGQQKYQEAVVNGSDAGLVEAKGKNIFSYSVSISPYQEIIVGLRYEQYIEKSLGGYQYIVPLSGRDKVNNVKDFSIDISLKAGLFLNDLQVENYRDHTKITWVSSNEASVSYYEYSAVPADDFIINYKLAVPPINGKMFNYNDGIDEFFFHVFSPQRSDLGGKALDKDIIFVLDKSGSMEGTKIRQLKEAFKEIINQLPTKDTFNLVMFDSAVKKYSNQLIGASQENKTKAVEYINNIDAGGGTNFNEGILTALEMFEISELKVPIVVMLSDGLPTAGVTNLKTIRENVKSQNTADVAVFSLGFGDDVDFEFLKALSLENYGIAIRIFEGEDASEQITNFYDTISTPLLKNLLFKYSEGAYEIYPVKVDRLFEGSEVVVVGKYDSPERSITSTVDATSWEGMRTFTETYELEEATNYSFIPRFWAYAKITYLLDFIAVYGNNESVIENVTNMALEYGFVTPYTSFLVEITEKEKEPETDDELHMEIDDDGDGVPNIYDPNPDNKIDTDNDGIPDDWEVTYGLDPNDPSDANTNTDGDGFANFARPNSTDPKTYPYRYASPPKEQDDDDIELLGGRLGSNLMIPLAITVIWIFIIISLFIYTRIKRNRLLEQKRREMIFNYIKEKPGEHFRGIQKALGLEVGVVAHHINILEREDLVKSRQDGMYRRFYPMDTKIDIKLILTKIQERILNRVKTNPGVSQKTIATHLGINRKVVNYHIKILQDAGFVYTEKQGRESLCYSVDAA
jgi:uncharacterized protein YegL/DNA-binding MarR family transcriptional regulator